MSLNFKYWAWTSPDVDIDWLKALAIQLAELLKYELLPDVCTVL